MSIVEKILDQYKENKLAHAYLIETNDKSLCYLSILNVIKQICCPSNYSENCNICNICRTIENGSALNIFCIDSNDKIIKKEQILELKRRMSYKVADYPLSVYIIIGAEKMNASSSNTLLKFLEEPTDDCYGFLIVDSKENVLPTVKSRCQCEKVIFDENNVKKLIDDKENGLYDCVTEYLNSIEKGVSEALFYNKNIIFEKYNEKESIQNILNIVLYIFCDILNNKNKCANIDFLKNKNRDMIINAVNIVTEKLECINSNANLELLLDRFVIEMGEVYE